MARQRNIDSPLEVQPICVYGAMGVNGLNDVVFKPALPHSSTEPPFKQKTLVYFGGDIQNLLHLMDQNDPNINYNRWCLESTANRLGICFPDHHIVIIKPSRIAFEDISCYDNFVRGNFLGMPNHLYHYNGLLHLETLLKTISKLIRRMHPAKLFKILLKKQEEEDYLDDMPTNIVWQYELMASTKRRSLFKWQKTLRLNKYPQTLIGFSKGCVVLNQFLYEFHYAKRLEPHNQDSRYIDNIETMYWLDASHPGQTNVYLTSRGLLKTLADLGIEIHSHVSQYQVEDQCRPWIGQQWVEFIETLKSFNAKVKTHRHAASNVNLFTHFSLLHSFKHVDRCEHVTVENGPVTLSLPTSPAPTPSTHKFPLPQNELPNEKDQVQRKIIGLALVSPNDSAYLGLQVILRRPYNDLTRAIEAPNSAGTSGSAQNSTEAQNTNDNAQTPSTSAQNPSASSDNPSSSRRSSSRVPSANGFMVLASRSCNKINFDEDHEAAEAYRTARHYKMETPIVAIPTERPQRRGLNLFSSVKDIYVPLLIPNRPSSSSSSENSSDSASSEPMENDERAGSPVNIVEAVSAVAPNIEAHASRDNNGHLASRRLQRNHHVQVTSRAVQANISQIRPSTLQAAPSVSTLQAAFRAATSHVRPRASSSQAAPMASTALARPRTSTLQNAPRDSSSHSRNRGSNSQARRRASTSQNDSRDSSHARRGASTSHARSRNSTSYARSRNSTSHAHPRVSTSQTAHRSSSQVAPTNSTAQIAHRSSWHVAPTNSTAQTAHRSSSHVAPTNSTAQTAHRSSSHVAPTNSTAQTAHRSSSHVAPTNSTAQTAHRSSSHVAPTNSTAQTDHRSSSHVAPTNSTAQTAHRSSSHVAPTNSTAQTVHRSSSHVAPTNFTAQAASSASTSQTDIRAGNSTTPNTRRNRRHRTHDTPYTSDGRTASNRYNRRYSS